MSAAWLFKPGCDRFAGSKGIRVAAQVASCKRRPDPVYRALPFLVLLHGDVAAAMHGEFGLAIDRLAQAAKTCCHERPSSSRFGSKLLRKLFGGFWGCVSNNCLRLFPACASTHFIKPLGSISQLEACANAGLDGLANKWGFGSRRLYKEPWCRLRMASSSRSTIATAAGELFGANELV